MSAQWLVVKFVEDLRRDEPVNIGLLVDVDGERTSRFHRVKRDGTIDDYSITWMDADNYRNWVRYWVTKWHKRNTPIEDMISNDPTSSFRVVHGGRVLAGEPVDDIDEFTKELWRILRPINNKRIRP